MSNFRRKLMLSPERIINETIPESSGTPGILYQGYNSAGASTGIESEITEYAVIGFEGGNAPADYDGYNNNSTLILKIPSFHNGKPITRIQKLNTNTITGYADWKTFKKIQFGLNMSIINTMSLRAVDSKEIYFPSSITKLNPGAMNMSGLGGNFQKIYYNAENASVTYDSESKNDNYGIWGITNYLNLEIYIGSSVKQLASGLFYDLSSKLKVKFSEKSICTIIGIDAFRESGVETINFPPCLQGIGKKAFYKCKKLLKVNLLNTELNFMGEQMFSGCGSLYALSLPSTLLTAGTNAFQGLTKIVQIRNLSAVNIPTIGKEGEVLTNKTRKFRTRMFCENNFIFLLTETKKYLFGYVGSEKNLDTSMYDYDSVYDYAGAGNTQGGQEIESIIFPNTLKYIEESAFTWNNLTAVNIPKSVMRIEKSVFDTGFTSVTIGDDAGSDCVYIGDRAFNTSKNNEVIFKGTNAPVLGANVFNTTYTKSIKIPMGSLASYQNGIGWANYVSLLQEV